ncbi:SixA phosphatase family protein [Parachitinimonas caeni]|uniref:Phosphoglycerate mutase family protein n=1 Tax=Parachitinimonas caeni TaxID=3031301 RepID=A0ABT7E3X0_9NEIS|nr:phosphoglycerate mutase family protein [Parachitinimonas caeni]MDK2126944.1 phosphoglycerate mutase family protein [Parachitinimonas caeni]
MKPYLITLLALFQLIGFACATDVAPADTEIILVRHADKASDDPVDPSLSSQGDARAKALAKVMQYSGLQQIFSSQYRRTRQTALAVAETHGLMVEERPINAENAESYAQQLASEIREKHLGKTILIVNHSDVVPDLVAQLTGLRIEPIAETEYDRLITLRLPAQGAPRLLQSRYGAP